MLRALAKHGLALALLYIVAIPFAWPELQFAVWRPPGFKYPYIIPVREGETFEHAVDRYQAALNINPDLRENLVHQPLHIPHGKITELEGEKAGPRALIIANSVEDT